MTDHDDREVDETTNDPIPDDDGFTDAEVAEPFEAAGGGDAEADEQAEDLARLRAADQDDETEDDQDDEDDEDDAEQAGEARSQRDETHLLRLQKVLANAGVASRRHAEIMIGNGRVEVNGRLVTEQGMRVDPHTDTIRVDGARIPPPRRHVYLVLNKPRGVVSTMEDPEGRPTLADIDFDSKSLQQLRLFHVGRLDTETEGLIILTNDGEFAHRMAHPSYKVPKTYLAEVEGMMDNRIIRRLEKGLRLEDGPVKPDKVKLVMRSESRSMIEITLHEGRNRVVRRMMDSVAHPVRKLSRTAIGPVRMGQLPLGETRELTREELGILLDLVKM